MVDERPSAEIATLTHRVADDGTVTVVRGVDPVGRFVLERLQARSAIAIPLADRGTSFGVLIAASNAEPPDDSVGADRARRSRRWP